MPRHKHKTHARKSRLIRLREEKLALDIAKLRPPVPKAQPLILPIPEFQFDEFAELDPFIARRQRVRIEFTRLRALEAIQQQEDAVDAFRDWLAQKPGLAAAGLEPSSESKLEAGTN